jgi:NAD(P)-dependent dehydrogenase (short-subunit alcohol dehydrogenase family)
VPRTALVTGANRGIGLEAARQLGAAGLAVVATARDEDAARETAERLRAEGHDASHARLDVTDADGIRAVAEGGPDVDVLVNNAGVVLDRDSVLDADPEVLRETLEVNLFGPLRTAQAFVPGMVERGYGRVVNVSSGAGSISEIETAYAPFYSVSKAALNALTRKLAVAVADTGADIKVNAMSPGWVRTDMGGSRAPRSVEEGADTIVWLATLPADGPNGGFFHDREPMAW